MLRPVLASLLSFCAPSLAAQDPAQPPAEKPVGPPVTTAEPAKQDVPPEERPEFDYVATSSEHPYVEIAGIVARDPRTGDLGAIVLSTSPGVGAFCVQAKADTGVAVVSGNADPTWASLAVELLAKGAAPADALQQVKVSASDSARERQQLVLLGSDGRGAVHLGEYLFGAGKTTDAAVQPDWIAFTTYAATDQTLAGMTKAFPDTAGLPLPERLLVSMQRALDALPVAKGKRHDLTGRAVSAALLVVRKDGGRLGRGDRLVDVRVDFDPEPMARLRGLYKVWALAHLGPALRTTMLKITDQQSEAYRANQEWMRRLRARMKFGEQR